MADAIAPQDDQARLLTKGMKWLLKVASVLVLIAGIQLFVQTEYTNTFFAWTIAPPKNLFITAAFLGAGYWSSCLSEWLSSNEPIWARARVAVASALVFSCMNLVATLLHLNRFHFNSQNPTTLIATYAWLVVYVAVPPVILILLIGQSKTLGVDPPRQQPLSRWVRLVATGAGGCDAGVRYGHVSAASDCCFSMAVELNTADCEGDRPSKLKAYLSTLTKLSN